MQRKDKELSGSSNGIVSGYHKWMKAKRQEITWPLKLTITCEEEAETPKESEKVQALKVELEKVKGLRC